MNPRVSWSRVFVAEEARLKLSLPHLLLGGFAVGACLHVVAPWNGFRPAKSDTNSAEITGASTPLSPLPHSRARHGLDDIADDTSGSTRRTRVGKPHPASARRAYTSLWPPLMSSGTSLSVLHPLRNIPARPITRGHFGSFFLISKSSLLSFDGDRSNSAYHYPVAEEDVLRY